MHDLQQRVFIWAARQFPQQTPRSCASHLLQEAAELYCTDPTTADARDEAADCAILLLTYAARAGFSLQDAIESKFTRLQARTWTIGPDGLAHEAGSSH